jgi:cation transport regulator
MPNHRMSDLTRVVQDNLPEHVQDIYQEAFNNAWQEYADSDGTLREETAHKVAWAAVKQSYRRNSRTAG